ncbi:hypothetical protein DAPPUDRAFT_239306 [Daphnia pulex]|uniref:Uncharacterized protein n=1 Tax=Daphnia pulex TaxID=6669 RepID=E9G8Y1_DAPPU|nr:hypothetical protein DAPPUDRAFT_239306 [Daphnia pulex]|eukprot:EFX84057.1 hypothetical protein DAPPUDRAFT_239306 [Daphnia pulex]
MINQLRQFANHGERENGSSKRIAAVHQSTKFLGKYTAEMDPTSVDRLLLGCCADRLRKAATPSSPTILHACRIHLVMMLILPVKVLTDQQTPSSLAIRMQFQGEI